MPLLDDPNDGSGGREGEAAPKADAKVTAAASNVGAAAGEGVAEKTVAALPCCSGLVSSLVVGCCDGELVPVPIIDRGGVSSYAGGGT